MEKIKYVFVIMMMLLITQGCSHNSNGVSPFEDLKYRTIAYKSLSMQERSTIADWRKAKVEGGIYKTDLAFPSILIDSGGRLPFIYNSSNLKLIDGQRLVAVIFNTTQDSLLGPIIVIIDPSNSKVIGYVTRM